MVIVIDFGSQYTQLIVRKIRELGFRSEILPFNTPIEEIINKKPGAIILSGGPRSVTEKNAPTINPLIWTLGIPLLGICYGMQLISQQFGGKVASSPTKEYGSSLLVLNKYLHDESPLFKDVPSQDTVWMSHGDYISSLPSSFTAYASTESCPFAAMGNPEKRIYGVQFHPEVTHTHSGKKILHNFLSVIAGLKPDWSIKSYLEETTSSIKTLVGEGKVIVALSGGVDSTIMVTLLSKTLPGQIYPIFIDHGLLRFQEADEVLQALAKLGIPVNLVNAQDRFFKALKKVKDGEKKRKIMGREFIMVLEAEAQKIPGVTHLAQGTIYPDVIESAVSVSGLAAKIKTHHNVGGLPKRLRLKLVEPLRYLFKDEVRELGKLLGLPLSIIERRPFPGPGLAVRMLGEVTMDRANKLRMVDEIFRDELKKWEGYKNIWQAFAVLTGVKTVGVKGDERSYEELVAIRAVSSTDGMTADWIEIPPAVLRKISERITREVAGVNRVVYDITTKPPSTIEWE
ncbi:MAG: GMP synthase (glutamine-hydrolyzing) [candidate division WS2 bacterium]|nr:GMP synthase (glutamine-hydrolyzing) [Candidatus Lithacetigena glycinireducens]